MYDFYCLKRKVPLEQIVLLPGETDGAKWVNFQQIHEMIQKGNICRIIAHQYLRQEQALKDRQNVQGE